MRTAIIVALHAVILIPCAAFVVAGTIDLWRNWDKWA